jgi:hypothetical protein
MSFLTSKPSPECLLRDISFIHFSLFFGLRWYTNAVSLPTVDIIFDQQALLNGEIGYFLRFVYFLVRWLAKAPKVISFSSS